MKYRIEVQKKLYRNSFRWVELNLWKRKEDFWVMKIHTKFPLSFYTLKILIRGFPGSCYVNWRNV